jgi:hypothetical protein
MSLPTYQTGTVSVAAGGTVVNGTGTIWSGINVKQGDWIVINNFAAMLVTEVTDETHLKIPPWPGAAQAGVPYVIYQNYVGRVVGVAAAEDVADMLERLRGLGPIYAVPAGETEPDPSYGIDGQYAYQQETNTWWLKSGGVWVITNNPVKGYGGTSTSSVTIGTGAKVFNTQPGLAYAGGRVRASYRTDTTKWLEGTGTYDAAAGTMTIASDTVGGAGTFADWVFTVAGGPPGAPGVPGPGLGIRQAYDPATADADPGNGKFRFNNATPAAATAAYLDNLDTGGATVSGIIDTWDDSTNSVRGAVRFEKATDPNVWAAFQITSAVIAGSGYRKLTLTAGQGSGAFTAGDAFAIAFFRAGDKGTDGLGAGDVVGPGSAVDANIAVFDTTTGKKIKDGGSKVSDLATAASVNSRVAKSGDTMTGILTLARPGVGGGGLYFDKQSSLVGAANIMQGLVDGVSRWLMIYGNGTAESGGPTGAVGSDFGLYRCDNSGTVLYPNVFLVDRATGTFGFGYGVTVGGALSVGTEIVCNGQAYSPMTILADGATVGAWDCSLGQKAKVTLGGNRTMSNPSNIVEGATYFLWIAQDTTGGRTMNWASATNIDFGAAGTPTLTVTPSKADLLTFEALSTGSGTKMRYTGIAKGFS